MTGEHVVGPVVDGSLLSCYTAAIAVTMARRGIDPEIAIGAQLFTAVDASDLAVVRFVHHHTQLLSASRVGSDDPLDALNAVADEVRRNGVAIVVGDAFRLPWRTDAGRHHTPHWFVVTGVDGSGDSARVRVVDAFASLTPWGPITPYEGFVAWAGLALLDDLHLDYQPRLASRERLAFGPPARAVEPTGRRLEWFTLDTGVGANQPALEATLARTAAVAAGGDVSLGPGAWQVGVAALGALADIAEQDPTAVLGMKDDLWVGARSRSFFVRALRRGSRDDLADWAEAELLPRWSALNVALEYTAQALASGRPARPLVARRLREVLGPETALTARLADAGVPARRQLAATLPAAGASPEAGSVGSDAWLATVVSVWTEVLASRIHAADLVPGTSFVDVGGDSLQYVRVMNRLSDHCGVELLLLELPTLPTVRAQAEAIAALDAFMSGPADGPLPEALDDGRGLDPISFRADVDAARIATADAEDETSEPYSADTVAMAPSQQRLWFLDQLEPGNAAYNVSAAFRVSGPLDVATLREAVADVVARHRILRASYHAPDGTPVMRVARACEASVDLRVVFGAREVDLLRAVADEADRPFDLAVAPLLRLLVLRVAEDDAVVVLTAHHISCDGWGLENLVGAVWRAYAKPSVTVDDPVAIGFEEYAAWERARLEGGVARRQLAYWMTHLADAPRLLPMPTDRPRTAPPPPRGAQATVLLPDADAVRALAAEEGTTPYAVLLAAWTLMLHRWTGAPDLVIGTVVANRRRTDSEAMIGNVANTVAVRSRLGPGQSFRSFVRAVAADAAEAQRHGDVPFDAVVAALGHDRDLAHNPVFQTLFVLQNAPRWSGSLDEVGLELRRFPVAARATRFDLVASVTESPSGFVLTVDYRTALFDAATIRELLRQAAALLRGGLAEPARSAAALPRVTGAARSLVLERFNATQTDWGDGVELVVHRLFEAQARRTPAASAVEAGDIALTYAEVDRRADRVADALRALGRNGDVREWRIGVCLPRSNELVIALLGVLKAGCAYVPLDPKYPPARLSLVSEDAGLAALVTTRAVDAGVELGDRTVRRVYVEEVVEQAALAFGPNPSVHQHQICYVIHTSGSTGSPKGVLTTHRGLANHLLWRQRAFPLGPSDRALHKTSFAFDASAWELFWPLITGGCVVMAPDGAEQDPVVLADVLRRRRVTVVDFVPSMLQLFLEQPDLGRLEHLRHVFTGSEAVPNELPDRFTARLGAQLHNGYGPTEATLGQAYWTIEPRPAGSPVPIGRPTANMAIYVVDAEGECAGIGLPGELCLAGDGLARGYLGRPRDTAARFVPDPFSVRPGQRMYRTGDIGRWRPDGVAEFLGRSDGQVKVRGYRIELREVEDALRAHPAVTLAVATVAGGATGTAERRLVASVVLSGNAGPAVDERGLRAFLSDRMPGYLVPGSIAILSEAPLLSNGKLDLAAMQLAALAPPTPPVEAVADAAARQLLAACASLLGRRVDLTDDFFDAGGHSLLAARLVASLRESLGVELPVRVVFETRSLGELAERLRAAPRQRRIVRSSARAGARRRERS